VSPHAPTLALRQRCRLSRAERRVSPCGRLAARLLGRGVRLTCHSAAAANRDCPSTPYEGHGAQRRCCPVLSRRWRVRHLVGAGHLKRRSVPVTRGRRKIREPWKRGLRIDRLSSVSAPQYSQRGSLDRDAKEVAIRNRHRVRTADLTESGNCITTIRGVISEAWKSRPSQPLARHPRWDPRSRKSGRSQR